MDSYFGDLRSCHAPTGVFFPASVIIGIEGLPIWRISVSNDLVLVSIV